ncbi:DUF6607 family protein [Chromatocurvus halotolerans]|uniref:Uncharacterized protein n=1 Tax=Chromatocurvus halotolerans TaxID=1132028 RepID=A0A4R2KVK7_9GAMM|nr:DUF6607 family protein [Chromatocurvus halotolerans]TCO78531.1 hypothetical protein EV688_101348 [Chromatocurvus halotolerans]
MNRITDTGLPASMEARLCLMSLLLVLAMPLAAQSPGNAGGGKQRQYTYSWLFAEEAAMAPRGGTTRGPEVTLEREPADAWQALQEPDITARERDRRAILAMAGDYRTTFDFIETIGLTPGYEPARPYRSWGTERVYVVKDTPHAVSLQHILVTRIRQDDGELSEPFVVKHWRQDWHYEDRNVQAFVAPGLWAHERLDEQDAEGRWTQSVFQVDDSPRYEASGVWVHSGDHSYWQSDQRRRPLPRREFSVRDDYQALLGSHRITITPSGWVQEEDALKLVLMDDTGPHPETPHLAREAGLSRYERIRDYDFSPGDDYWQRTGPFWSAVRDYWSGVYAQHRDFRLEDTVDGKPLFVSLFELAEAYADEPKDTLSSLSALMARAVIIEPE